MMLNSVKRYTSSAILGLSITSVLMLGACSSNNISSTKNVEPSSPVESANPSTNERISIHLSGQKTEEYKNLSSGIRRDIEFIYSNANRGFYENVENNDASPSILESILDKDDTSNYTYVRLINDPHIPKEGENWVGYKDLLIYLDPENPSNAYLASQDPKDENKWAVYILTDYGKWFQTELDLTLKNL